MLFLRGRCPTLQNRGLHDVGHVGAATGRGAKPRQAFQGALAEPTVAFLIVMRHLIVSANALNPLGVAGFYATGS